MSGPALVPADPEDRAGLERIAEHLDRGGLLAHPTETVYGLGAAATLAGVAALRALKGRGGEKPFLALVSDESALELAWTPPARALARAFWPGPLTLVLFDPEGRFPPGARSAPGGVAVRVSSHRFVRSLLRVWGGALLSTSANSPGEPALRTAEGVMTWARGRPGSDELWVADGGAIDSLESSTIVDCTGARPALVRPGAISLGRIREVVPSTIRRRRRMAGPRAGGGGSGPAGRGGPGEPFRLLFVCTGNTCRSPLAEAIASRGVRELGWEHVEVRSAGTAAATGEPASEGSLRAGERHGLDLSRHKSAPLTPDLVEWADVVLTMSASHLHAVWSAGGAGKASLITDFAAGRESGQEHGTGSVADPMGGDDEEYEATFHALDALVSGVLERLAPLVAP